MWFYYFQNVTIFINKFNTSRRFSIIFIIFFKFFFFRFSYTPTNHWQKERKKRDEKRSMAMKEKKTIFFLIRISVRLRKKFSTQILFCSSTSFFSDHYFTVIPCNFVLILTVIQHHQSLDTICTYLLSESSHFWGAQSKQKKNRSWRHTLFCWTSVSQRNLLFWDFQGIFTHFPNFPIVKCTKARL